MATPIKTTNNTWRIRVGWTDENGVKQVKCKSGFPTANKAILWAEDFKKKMQQTGYDSRRMRLSDVVELVKENKILKGNTPRTVASFLYHANIVVDEFKNPFIDSIRAWNIESFFGKIKNTPAKAMHIRSALSIIFNYAFKKGIIDFNAFDRAELPNFKCNKVKPVPEKDYFKLLEITKKHYPLFYAMYLLSGICGLRPAEALALKEKDIKEDSIYIRAAVCVLSAKENALIGNEAKPTELLKDPKSKAGIRVIPITKDFYNELHYAKNLYNIKSEWIVCNILGEKLLADNVRKTLGRICKKYGINKFTLYQMRHYFGNSNKRNGVDRFTTATLMGHADTSITEKYYYSEDKVLSKNATNKVIDNFMKFKK